MSDSKKKLSALKNPYVSDHNVTMKKVLEESEKTAKNEQFLREMMAMYGPSSGPSPMNVNENLNRAMAESAALAAKKEQENQNRLLAEKLSGLRGNNFVVSAPPAAPPAAPPSSLTEVNVRVYKTSLHDNLSNGDCFFSAIFRAALKENLVNQILDCLLIDRHLVSNENTFISEVRGWLKNYVNLTEPTQEFYNNLNDLYKAKDIDTIKEILRSLNVKFAKYINDFLVLSKPKKYVDPFISFEVFNTKFGEIHSTSGEWVDQIVVNIIKNELKNCDIQIDIYTDLNKAPEYLPKSHNGVNYIYLYNSGNVHYKHYLLNKPSKKITLKRNFTPGIENASWRGGKRSITRRKTALKNKMKHRSKQQTRKPYRTF